jgi:recombinational DNA repair protein RecT
MPAAPTPSGGTHAKFDEEMVHRTVIRRACKPFINASSDRYLLAAIQASDEANVEAEVNVELEDHANAGAVLELEPPAGGTIEAEVIPSDDVDGGEDANAERRGF